MTVQMNTVLEGVAFSPAVYMYIYIYIYTYLLEIYNLKYLLINQNIRKNYDFFVTVQIMVLKRRKELLYEGNENQGRNELLLQHINSNNRESNNFQRI